MGPQLPSCDLLDQTAHKQVAPRAAGRRDRGRQSVSRSLTQSLVQSVNLPVCLGLLPRMAAVPSDNAHEATPHHLRNKGPHANAQSPAHHTSWTHHRIHASYHTHEWQLASNERAGQRETRAPAYINRSRTRSYPRKPSTRLGHVALPRGLFLPCQDPDRH